MRKLVLFLSLLWAISVPAQIRKAVRKVQVELVGSFSVAGQNRVDVILGGPQPHSGDQEHLSLICDDLGPLRGIYLPHYTTGAYNPDRGTITLEANRFNLSDAPPRHSILVSISCRVHSHQWWRPESPQHGAPAG